MLFGVDRWRGGWIVAATSSATDGTALDGIELFAVDSAQDLVDRSPDLVAIDMPMALPAHGTRDAEAMVRTMLGRSARSVFTSPTRAAIEAADQAEATVVNRAHGGPGISAQSWGLAGSIRELRSTLRASLHQPRWYETHPETAFAVLNDGDPCASKRSARGVGQRLELLRSVVPNLSELLVSAPEKVPVDDVLDCLAALWSAQRIAHGNAQQVGPDGLDDDGFRQAIFI